MARARFVAIAGLAIAALAGCALPAYRRPAIAVPPAWRESTAAAPWPATDWWRGFRSPELDALILRAGAANLDLTAAVARVKQADAQARIAGAPLFPSLDVAPQARRTRELLPVGAGTYTLNDFALPLEASYEIDFWGKNRAARASARESAGAARFDQEVVALGIVTGVASTYFECLALEQRLDVARQNLANGRRILTGLELERRAGTATDLEVVQQQTLVATLAAAIPPLESQLSQSTDALALLLAKPPEAVVLRARTLDGVDVPEVGAGLPSELLARRPDVREAEASLIAAHFDIQNARAQFLPAFTLTASGGVESTALADLFSAQSRVFDLGAGALQQLFTGGRLTGQLRLSRARFEELVADYRKAALAAFGDVEDSLAAVSRSREQLAQQAIAVERARTAFRLSEQQFRGGTVTILTMLQTETALFSAEDAFVQAKLTRLEATISLFKALGGGWSDTPAPPLPGHSVPEWPRDSVPALPGHAVPGEGAP